MSQIQTPSHLGGSYAQCNDANTFMPDNWEYLIKKYDIKSVVDVGTGYGWNAEWFLKRGLNVIGIEGDPLALVGNRLPKENLIAHDYTTGPFPFCDLNVHQDILRLMPKDHVSLAWCSEFVEHVEEKFIPNYVATFKCCKYLCMTHGEPGQDGCHHVNCQMTSYWIEKLFGYGFLIDADETAYLRSTDKWKAGWGRRTLCWFKNLDYDEKTL